MNIKNLKEGQVIKNYKELCNLLEIKSTTNGITKNNQLKKLETLCKYRKEGNKFIIEEIYKNPISPEITIKDIIKSRNNKYIKPLANIIVEYLYNNPKEVSNVPISKLFTLLGITNNNYVDCNYYRKELSQLYDIRLASIYYFYSNTKMEFKNIIERCLNNLKNRRVLNWYKVIMIKDKTTNQIYKADKETEKFIIDTEKETLKYLNVNNMYELMKDKIKLKEFDKMVNKETGIDYFYAYDLVIGERALKIEYDTITEEKENLNKLIINRTKTIFGKNKYLNFSNDYNKLNDILIDIANEDLILNKLKDKRKENIINYTKDNIKLNEKYEEDKREIEEKYIDTYLK